MNLPILNRNFQHPSDGWYQIEPLGEHPNPAAKLVQIIDNEAAALIVNRFNRDAAAGGLSHGSEMLIDHEHFKHDQDKETRAYGWLQELQNRSDGIYGRIRWTTTGKAAVDGGDYRFFSTEYDPNDLKVLNASGSATRTRRVRPLRLDGLTLTNNPNNKGQKPITNRSGSDLPVDPRGSAADNPQHERKAMKSVSSKLGLSVDASEEAVLAEVVKIINRAETAEGKLGPLTTENATLKTQTTELLGEQIDALLDGHGVKEEKLRNRIKPMLTGLKNREDRLAALADLGHKPLDAKAGTHGRVLNRDESKPREFSRATTTTTQITPQELQAEVRKIMNRDGTKDFTAAYNQLMAEKPELFAKAE